MVIIYFFFFKDVQIFIYNFIVFFVNINIQIFIVNIILKITLFIL